MIVLFAVDTNMLVTAQIESILQHKVMNELQTWFYTNSFVINTEKTIAMLFHTRQTRTPLMSQVKFDVIISVT
jgi:hypothetical protein